MPTAIAGTPIVVLAKFIYFSWHIVYQLDWVGYIRLICFENICQETKYDYRWIQEGIRRSNRSDNWCRSFSNTAARTSNALLSLRKKIPLHNFFRVIFNFLFVSGVQNWKFCINSVFTNTESQFCISADHMDFRYFTGSVYGSDEVTAGLNKDLLSKLLHKSPSARHGRLLITFLPSRK